MLVPLLACKSLSLLISTSLRGIFIFLTWAEQMLLLSPSFCPWAVSKLDFFTPACRVHLDQRSNGWKTPQQEPQITVVAIVCWPLIICQTLIWGCCCSPSPKWQPVHSAGDLSTSALTSIDNSSYLQSHLSPCLRLMNKHLFLFLIHPFFFVLCCCCHSVNLFCGRGRREIHLTKQKCKDKMAQRTSSGKTWGEMKENEPLMQRVHSVVFRFL